MGCTLARPAFVDVEVWSLVPVEITISEANLRCEESVRRNLKNIERKDEDTMYQVMEATRRQEESNCEMRVEEAVLAAGRKYEEEWSVRVEEAGRVR